MENITKSFKRSLEIFIGKHERIIIYSICLLAMVRVFVFCAAFPFFNNVDEEAHFDTVVKYSNGYLPKKGGDFYSRESAELISLCLSPEYLVSSEKLESAEPLKPLWLRHNKETATYVKARTEQLISFKNHEAFSFPVYYVIAGCWYNIGKVLGFKEIHILYWIRFLNVIVYGMLVFFSYLLCKSMYKDDLHLRIGAPLFLIFFPQDLFYSINSDVPSPLFVLISLYMLMLIHLADRSILFYLGAGLMIAFAMLTKLSNFPILVVFFFFFISFIRKSHRMGRLKSQGLNYFLLFLGTVIPITLWLGWNFYALGDITGSSEKLGILGWEHKPWGSIFDHPIFTVSGLHYFLSDLTKTFWRGEFVWQLEVLALEKMDLFFVISSLLFVLAGVIGPFLWKKTYPGNHRKSNIIIGSVVLLFVLFLAFLSIIFDYGDSSYPSQEKPFFTSGRLISGALAPFCILYLYGLVLLLSKISRRLSPILVVLLIVILVAWVEIYLTSTVFGSSFNWFHNV